MESDNEPNVSFERTILGVEVNPEAPVMPAVLKVPFEDVVVEVVAAPDALAENATLGARDVVDAEVVVLEEPPNVEEARVKLPCKADEMELTDASATKHTQPRQRISSIMLEPAQPAEFGAHLSVKLII